MRSMIARILGSLVTLACSLAFAQQATPPDAASLMPAQTQAFVRISSLPQVVERWKETQLGALTELPGMKEFWSDQRSEIESRLAEAGWRMNLHPQDIYDICSGQVAVGWIDRQDTPNKPYSVALIVDIEGREEAKNKLLERVHEELIQRKALREDRKVGELNLIRYELPKQPGESQVIETFYGQINQQLWVADDLQTITEMLRRLQQPDGNDLATTPAFQKTNAQLETLQGQWDFNYFVRPIGLAKVLRTISRKPVSKQSDLLKALENQGFGHLEAVAGRASIKRDSFDLLHEAFILAPQPLPKTVQVLDFPNNTPAEVPAWVSQTTASFMAVSWNLKDAFWKVEGLVDEVAGKEGTFSKVIEQIQKDPLGPQVDIRQELMPYLTDEIYAMGDCVEPITPDSKRSMIAIRIREADKLSVSVDKVMRDEPDAEMVDFQGHKLWRVARKDDQQLDILIDDGFGEFNTGKDKEEVDESAQEEEEPWLSNWAIAVYGDFLFFSSHAEMIQEAITHLDSSQPQGTLAAEQDFARAKQAIAMLSDGKPSAMWQINRTDRSFQMQYELFRQDKLPESRSMLATLADRLLRSKTEKRDKTQRVKGDLLPAYEVVRKYLLPSGVVVQTEDQGWSIRSFLLGAATPETEATSQVQSIQLSDRQAAAAPVESRQGSVDSSGTKR